MKSTDVPGPHVKKKNVPVTIGLMALGYLMIMRRRR